MLDALSTTLTHTITLLAKSFRLSSLFPALCFVVVNYLLFLSRLFDKYGTPSWLKDGNFGHPLFLTFMLAALISYTLNYLNFSLIYLAEGYPFRHTWWGQLMIAWYKGHMDWLKEQANSKEIERKFYLEKLTDWFPPKRDRCTPTSLGNVMAAFEAYPWDRYHIDAVCMWPRLLPVLNEEKYAVFVEREKEGFDFFLNLAVLSGLLVVECVLLRLLWELPTLTLIALLGGCTAFAFYQAAVWCARNWGETIKTAFDLYRYQLAERLALKPFERAGEELKRWEGISYFIQGGKETFDFDDFNYPLPKRREAQEDKVTQRSASSEQVQGRKEGDE